MSSPRQSGYAGTPLATKLGLKDGIVACAIAAPDGYRDWLGPAASAVRFVARPSAEVQLVHLFTTQRAVLGRMGVVAQAPKRASKVATDVNEDVVRNVALPPGFVDVKVCAIDDTWSGLKPMVRKSLRTPASRS